MNTILLQPTDVLFFRDGRPMGGSLAGHGAAWPLPTVTDSALHAALHRSELKGHPHRRGCSGIYSKEEAHRDRTFGSLVTAGPFPVRAAAPAPRPDEPQPGWYFSRPLDLGAASLKPTLLPTALDGASSLPSPLIYAVGNTAGPAKESAAKAWLSAAAYERYVKGPDSSNLSLTETIDDRGFSDSEATIGIAIDSETQTTGQGSAEGKIYSAHYLRLRDGWRLGLFAKTDEKPNGDPAFRPDLIPQLINDSAQIVVGGQQRICMATLQAKGGALPLPYGMNAGFTEHRGKYLVKWVLLAPGLWPEIVAGQSKRGTERRAHPGGWLPTWINPDSGEVLLRIVNDDERKKRRRLNYDGKGYATDRGNAMAIAARLVAALVPKPIVVTGWALPHEAAERPEGGAKPTHLAVPAGAVFYFEAASETEARNLAATLNWHGDTNGTEIKNRRSTLFGEKGFGLGVCGSWLFHGEAHA